MNDRWEVVNRLDEDPDLCWAQLVPWALCWDVRLRDCRVTSSCFAGPGETCYCGKLPKATADDAFA